MNTTNVQQIILAGLIEFPILCILACTVINMKRMTALAKFLSSSLKQTKEVHNERRCKKCNALWFGDERYCTFCGAEGDWHITCSLCSTMMPREARYCPHCHNRMWLSGSNVEGAHLYGSPKVGIDTVHMKKVKNT